MAWILRFVGGEIWVDLNIEMEECAHASANSLWIEMVDCWRNNSDVADVEGERSAHDGAKVASVGGVNEKQMILIGVDFGLGLFEFCDEEASVFGAKDIEGFA